MHQPRSDVWLPGPAAGPDHYRTYPMAQDAVRHSSASVDTPLSRSAGPNGSSDMSYASTASVDSGPDEMAEIPELGSTPLLGCKPRTGGQDPIVLLRSQSHVTEGSLWQCILQQSHPKSFLEHGTICACLQRHSAGCRRKHQTGSAA